MDDTAKISKRLKNERISNFFFVLFFLESIDVSGPGDRVEEEKRFEYLCRSVRGEHEEKGVVYL